MRLSKVRYGLLHDSNRVVLQVFHEVLFGSNIATLGSGI